MSNGSKAQKKAEEKFRAGTFIGKTFNEIEEAGIFGRRLYPRAKRGKWNLPHRLEYAGGLQDANPYLTEVGFFANKEAAYFLIRKRTVARGQRMNQAEILSHLERVAPGGKWDDGARGEFPGTLYTYRHKAESITFRLFGYRTHNSRQILIFPPSVSPNLEGRTRAPRVFLR